MAVVLQPALTPPDKPSIAVLPFTNMSGDPEQEYFADGITEDLLTALSRIRWLFVIARNSSFVFKGRAIDVKEVGRQLGVRYVLEGSTRRAGNRVRITGQLIEAAQWATRAREQGPEFPVALRFLAASLADLGQVDAAHAVVQDLLAVQPNATLTRVRQSHFATLAMVDLYAKGLQTAGLPE
jgi:TolB-like protein